MTREDDIDALAGEYVLGTLDPAERAAGQNGAPPDSPPAARFPALLDLPLLRGHNFATQARKGLKKSTT